MLITSNDIYLYTVNRPNVQFTVQDSNELALSGYESKPLKYCLALGNQKAEGRIILFPKNSDDLIINTQFGDKFYFNLYDPLTEFMLDDIFIGPDLSLHITEVFNNKTKGLGIMDEIQDPLILLEPLELLEKKKIELQNSTISMDLATYATNFDTVRMHLIFTQHNYLVYSFTDIDYFSNVMKPAVTMISSEVRGASFVSSFMYSSINVTGNSYLHVFSVGEDNVPVNHIFIVSDIVSWIDQIRLTDNRDVPFYTDRSDPCVTYISEDNVFIVKGYVLENAVKKYSYYFFNLNNTISAFDKISSDETQQSVKKFIYISANLYYIIYENTTYIDVYTLAKAQNRHFIEFRLCKLLLMTLV